MTDPLKNGRVLDRTVLLHEVGGFDPKTEPITGFQAFRNFPLGIGASMTILETIAACFSSERRYSNQSMVDNRRQIK
jgi:hypothetical protein